MNKNIMVTITEYLAKKNKIEQAEKEIEILKNQIIEYMGNNEELIIGQYKATNKTCTRKGIDSKRLRETLPDIAKEYETITEYKRFTCC